MEHDTERLLNAMLNLTAAHREHEKFYSVSPREQAVVLQRHSRTLHALADRWLATRPTEHEALSPYESAEDLNSRVATQLDGVLFMEGEGEPTEIIGMKRLLRAMAADAAAAGEWLATAMQSSWAITPQLFSINALADVLGERHRIIINNWQAASLMTLVGRVLDRVADLLDHVDFTPAALRADLAADRTAPAHLRSAAEMLGHAADLLSEFATLVHDNERRWRVFRTRVEHALAETRADGVSASSPAPA
jgi:hypothetical protein